MDTFKYRLHVIVLVGICHQTYSTALYASQLVNTSVWYSYEQ